ncbi:MAG TPA: hypothetical protein VFF12_11370 [Myxococcaceae bacterium]|nr:hypothetical protein [Myxococcaceae bacterium]
MTSRLPGPPAWPILATLATLLLAAGCGAGPEATDSTRASDLRAADRQGAVHGSRVLHFVDGNGHVTDVPDPIAPFDVGALVRDDPHTTFIPAVVNGNQFTIPGVPNEAYDLVFQAPGAPGPTHDITDERSLDFDQFVLGRANVVSPGNGTTLALDLSGLEAWDPNNDDLQITAPGAGLGFSSVLNVGLAPQAGSTSFAASVDYASYTGANGGGGLIDTSQGDRVFLTQLTPGPSSADVASFNRLTRGVEVTSLIMADGATTPLSAALAPVAQTSSFDLTLRRGEFDALRADVGTGAQIAFSFTGVDALPAGLAAGVIGGTPDLVTALVLPGTTDVPLSATYGNPFPARWSRFGFLATIYRVPISVPTPGGPVTFTQSANVFFQADLSSFTVHGLRPLVGPVHAATVGGQPMLAGASGVGTTPRVAWEAPLVGQPTSYTVRLQELTVSGSSVSSRTLANILTHQRHVRIPTGLMVPGGKYVIVVNADLTGPFDQAQTPLRTGYPVAVAPAVSGVITP